MASTTLVERIRNERQLVDECLWAGGKPLQLLHRLISVRQHLSDAEFEAKRFEVERDEYWRKKKADD